MLSVPSVVSDLILQDISNLHGSTVKVLMVLGSHTRKRDGEWSCWVGYSRIARLSGVSHDTVARSLRQGEERGIIQRRTISGKKCREFVFLVSDETDIRTDRETDNQTRNKEKNRDRRRTGTSTPSTTSKITTVVDPETERHWSCHSLRSLFFKSGCRDIQHLQRAINNSKSSVLLFTSKLFELQERNDIRNKVGATVSACKRGWIASDTALRSVLSILEGSDEVEVPTPTPTRKIALQTTTERNRNTSTDKHIHDIPEDTWKGIIDGLPWNKIRN